MSNNIIERSHGSATYSPGETSVIELPRSHFFENLELLMDYTVTTGSSAAQVGNGILDLIDSITVEFDGDKTPKSYSGATSHFLAWLTDGTRPLHQPVDYSVAEQQSGQVQFEVDFLTDQRQYGTMFPAFMTSAANLRIRWATDSAVGDDVTVDDAEVRVSGRERRKGAFSPKALQGIKKNLKAFKESETVSEVTQTGENRIRLPVGNVYHSVMVQVRDGAQGTPTNDLVERMELVEEGVETHKSQAFDEFRADNLVRYGVEQLADGVAVLNYGFKGDTTDAISTAGLDRYELIVDTETNTPDSAEVSVVPRTIV